MPWRLAVLAAVLALMLAAETFWAARPWHDGRLKRLLFHGAVMASNSAVSRLLIVPPLLAWATVVRARGWGLAPLLGLAGWREVAASVVVLDFLDYVWHVMNHRVFFLWRFHRAHHVDTHVDTTTALRFHPGELALSGLMKAGWLAAWGPSAFAFALFETLITGYAQFHHANIDFPDPVERALRWAHMTPRLHAAHHTAALRTRDANFSTIFLWWDRLFGTFQEADGGELETLGLPEGRRSDLSPAAFLAAPVRLGP